MSILIFNINGIVMAIVAFGAAYALRWRWPGIVSDGMMFMLAAVLCVMLDLLWRARRNNRHWFGSKQGGTFLQIPVWVLGILVLAVTMYQRYYGIAAFPNSIAQK